MISRTKPENEHAWMSGAKKSLKKCTKCGVTRSFAIKGKYTYSLPNGTVFGHSSPDCKFY